MCDLAYRSSQCPALRVNQLSISFSSLESYHCLRKAPTCGGYLCVVFNFPPEWGPWSWLSFCFPDWLPTLFFTEPAQNKVHTPLTYKIRSTQTLTTGWLCAFSVFLLLPLPSLVAFRSQRKMYAPFYGWPLHLYFGSFSPPASFWPSLHQWSASSPLRPFGVFVYSFSTHTLNACCCPMELWQHVVWGVWWWIKQKRSLTLQNLQPDEWKWL